MAGMLSVTQKIFNILIVLFALVFLQKPLNIWAESISAGKGVIVSSSLDVRKDDETQEIKSSSEDIRLKLRKHQAEVKAYSEEELKVISGLNEFDLALNEKTQRVHAIRLNLSEVEKKMKSASEKSAVLLKEINQTERYIAKRLSALYKMSLIGPMHILASSDSMYDLLYRKFVMERILEYDENILKTQTQNRLIMAKLLKELDYEKNEKLVLEEDLENQITIISGERRKRVDLLKEIRNKKSLELAAIDSLRQAEKALDRTILSLHGKPEKSAKEPLKHFKKYKGLLNIPVSGKIITFFGPYKNRKFNVINFRSGIEIMADRGEPIQAVQNGIVLYSGWFKSYGNMIIIDHGMHYYSVYAHAEELFKSKGDPVEEGEVIATVGDTASMTGSNLYFELRHRGKPIDPLKWLKKVEGAG
jgi:septal ring factor EnvC (AmiA/AmiB activator)